MKNLALAVAALLFSLVPGIAEACTVCPLGSERNGHAYLIAGILVSSVQLVAGISLVLWVRRQNRPAA
ncbi:MAG: hypothetical protein VKP57_09625 [Candidatus Sericytochromatia bacterium]|nr:hypothetical protein [Candidatus Sericytochromatia bacterium]